MHDVEILITSLLLAIVALSAVARWTSLPQPVALLAGGAALSIVPGLPDVRMEPDLVLFVFLPPLLYVTALNANVSDFRRDKAWIVLNSVVLVLATMAVVAVIAHALVPGLSWASSFVLGAIVSPTDPLAAALIMRRLGVPQRLVSVVEGEGLFNDATAFVAYRVAVTAVVAREFSMAGTFGDFVLGIVVGVFVGWVIARGMVWLRSRVDDMNVNVTLSLLTGYAAFIAADALHGSGVVATVVAGLVVNRRFLAMIPARTRLYSRDVWELVDFILNALLFLLIGLQLPHVVDVIDQSDLAVLTVTSIAVAVTMMALRMLWFCVVPLVYWRLRPVAASNAARLPERVVLGASGMRGAVSLALALAIPLTTDAGRAFPQRDLVVFVTFIVIAVTILVPSLALPRFIRTAEVHDHGDGERLEIHARIVAARSARVELDILRNEDWTREDTIDRLSAFYENRVKRFEIREDADGDPYDHPIEERSRAYQRTTLRVLEAQRVELASLHARGEIPTETLRTLVRELDLEEARLEI